MEPEIETMKRFADYLDTSVDYLVGYTNIRHKIEPVDKYELNREEAILIEKYRRLSGKFRASVLSIMDDLLSKN